MLPNEKVRKKIKYMSFISQEKSPIHTSPIARAVIRRYSFELLSDLHYLIEQYVPEHYLFSKHTE